MRATGSIALLAAMLFASPLASAQRAASLSDRVAALEQRAAGDQNGTELVNQIGQLRSEVQELRGQIEQLQAQLLTVSGQADLSTLTVTLIPRAEPVEAVQSGWDPGATWSSAVASLVGIGQGLLDVLIWFAVVWLPVLLVVGLIGLLVWWGSVEVRRRMPPRQERERQAS